MNHRSTVRSLATEWALALALATVAQTAMAAGQHAGGHDKSAIGEPGKAASVGRTDSPAVPRGRRKSPQKRNHPG